MEGMMMSAAAPIQRKIIHIDMDAFYASVEQRDFPELRGKPLVVGGSPEGRGGVVATASYEARKFGIHSAMSSKTAQRLCPEVIFVYPRFDVYKAVSGKLHEIFHRYTDMIEPLSLDEAYLDVTVDKLGIGYAMDIAREIKKAVKEELNLTASAGVSISKFVAKIASDLDKPDGLTFIGPSRVEAFMEGLKVEKFHGVGKVTAARMQSMGIHKGADLKKYTEPELIRLFGKTGRFYYNIVRGIDNRPVMPYRETKSVSVEDTYQEDLTDKPDMLAEFTVLAGKLQARLEKNGLKGRTLTLKFKFHDFTIITRSRSVSGIIDGQGIMVSLARELLEKTDLTGKKIRLLGIGVSNFSTAGTEDDHERGAGGPIQLTLF